MDSLKLTPEQIESLKPGPLTEPFNIKSNRRFQLSSVYPPGTYIIDFMFVLNRFTYLVCINGNTRMLYVELTSNTSKDRDGNLVVNRDAKTSTAFITALQAIMSRCGKIRRLIGDGESAFVSAMTKRFYDANRITFIPVRRESSAYAGFMTDAQSKVKSSPNHTSLGIIDRVIRTIRDMAYQMSVESISPEVMRRIVQFYDVSPHRTLSKLMGFDVPPDMAELDPDLEHKIIRRIQIKNYQVRNQFGFVLPIGRRVYIFNPKDTLLKRRAQVKPYIGIVEGMVGSVYLVRTPDGVEKCSRSQLKPVD
jgi:hypothetical protein